MLRRLCTGSLILLTALTAWAQEASEPQSVQEALKGKSLTMHLIARIIDSEEVSIWEASANRYTIPGRSVSIKMVGENIIIVAHFTPYLRSGSEGNTLVAQGEVWVAGEDGMIRYHSSLQTIPMKLGEPVFFFPLGQSNRSGDADRIEVRIEVQNDTGDRP